MILERDIAINKLKEGHRLIDALMAWDNNVLDEPSACEEYKRDIEKCLEWVERNEDLYPQNSTW